MEENQDQCYNCGEYIKEDEAIAEIAVANEPYGMTGPVNIDHFIIHAGCLKEGDVLA